MKELAITAGARLTVTAGGKAQELPAGDYSIKIIDAEPARQRFHLFVKGFLPTETAEARNCAAEWKQKGYDAEIMPFGRQFHGQIDNRNLWVSVARLDSEEKATALQHKLQAQKVWGWIMPEIDRQGAGTIAIADARNKTVMKVKIPVQISSESSIKIANINTGFFKDKRASLAFSGKLELRVGIHGRLDVIEHVSIEEYLKGVLPAEMPAEWPAEALKAQAVAARSEILSALSGKHSMEGYDFCAVEHCRAYGGSSAHKPATNAAVDETLGEVLVSSGRIVAAVFSANCGGWTENNDAVWAAPAQAALRGVADIGQAKPAFTSLNDSNISNWLRHPPPAHCAGNKDNFRWTRRFTTAELTAIVNKKYPVGTVKHIELGERGVSGRLKWVRIRGERGQQLVQKELNIRLAFGGLLSAMFIVVEDPSGSHSRGGSVPKSFTFIGGGRGHGVGLCQEGARGMALEGAKCAAILKHYFSGVEMVRLN